MLVGPDTGVEFLEGTTVGGGQSCSPYFKGREEVGQVSDLFLLLSDQKKHFSHTQSSHTHTEQQALGNTLSDHSWGPPWYLLLAYQGLLSSLASASHLVPPSYTSLLPPTSSTEQTSAENLPERRRCPRPAWLDLTHWTSQHGPQGWLAGDAGVQPGWIWSGCSGAVVLRRCPR